MKESIFHKYRSPIIFGMLVLMLGGVYAYRQVQVSLFPEITFPKIKVIADNGEQPVDKMMITITRPLEDAIKLIPGMKGIRSTTSRGSCEISAFLDWDANVYTSQQLIESRIAAIRNDLPSATQITIERMNPSILPVMGYSLESNNKSLMELKLLAEYTIKPYLSQVEGVSAVRVQGGKTKEFWIQLDPLKLSQYNLTPGDVSAALAKTDFIRSNGFMNSYRRLYLNLTDAGLYSIKDIESVPLLSGTNKQVFVKDIGKVNIEDKIEYVKINANGHEGVLVNILKQPNANLIQVTDAMDQKIKDIVSILPAGVTLKPFYKQSDFVNDSIKSIRDALLIGLFLAIVVAILFLRSGQASVAILFTIPITLSFSLLIMLGLGYTLNIMTIGGIAAAIGLVIDDAVVVIEQMHRTREEHPETNISTLVQKAIHYLFPAMVATSLSTIVIFLPFSLMTGVAGAYFKILAYTMIITLTCSFIVTAIGLPAFYGWLVDRFPDKLKVVHHTERKRWVDFLIHRPWVSALFTVALLAATIIIIPQLKQGFLPEMDEGSIVLDFNSPPGTSIEETDVMLKKVDKIILNTPEVVSYSRRTGTQMGFFITEPNRGDYLIGLRKKRSRTTEEVIADIRHRVESQLPALTVDFGQVIGDMLGDLMTSVQPIELKVFGPDRNKIKVYASDIAKLMEQVPGTADVFDGIVIAGPNIDVKPNYAALANYGLSPEELQSQLETAIHGRVVGQVVEKQQLTDIRMIYANGPKQSYGDLDKIPILLPQGKHTVLENVATVSVKQGVAEQERENLQPIVAVTGRLEGRDLGSVMKDVQQSIRKNINFEKGYGVLYGGSYAEQQHSFRELLTILILASLLVLLVQMVLFRNVLVGFVIIFNSLLGIGGSVLALYVTGTPLNVGSYTGIIMVVGIIAENAIFTFQQFITALETHDRNSAINFAIAARLRPKLMTALGAIMALSPLALGIGAGAQLHQPLAIAVIGGLIVALPLLLIVFPTFLRFLKVKGSEG